MRKRMSHGTPIKCAMNLYVCACARTRTHSPTVLRACVCIRRVCVRTLASTCVLMHMCGHRCMRMCMCLLVRFRKLLFECGDLRRMFRGTCVQKLVCICKGGAQLRKLSLIAVHWLCSLLRGCVCMCVCVCVCIRGRVCSIATPTNTMQCVTSHVLQAGDYIHERLRYTFMYVYTCTVVHRIPL